MEVLLRDVAKEAGVSTATVSRVINNRSNVSEKTRQKVEEVMVRLGYDPKTARGPKGEQRLVTLVVPDITSLFFAEVVSGVEQELYNNGFDLVLQNVGSRSFPEVIDRLNNIDAEGLVMVTPQIGQDEALDASNLDLPLVVVDYHNEGSRAPHVSIDNLRAGFAATTHLVNKGHSVIGKITGPLNVQSAIERLRGYRLALDEAGIPFRSSLVCEGDFTEAGGYNQTRNLLKANNEPPTAVFCSNDLMAVGAIRALREMGLSVPRDVAVIGFDDLSIASLVNPSLTTIHQPIREMAVTATKLLLRLIAGEKLETDRIILETRLVTRETT